MALVVLIGDGISKPQIRPTETFDPAREANHRVANVLTMIASGVRLQASSAAKRGETMSGDEVRLLLAGIAARVDAAGQVHRLLSNGAKESDFDLGEQVEKICLALQPFASLVGPVELSCRVENRCPVASAQIIPLALIVCEMVTNAIKYAHPAGAPGSIQVSVTADNLFTILEVADDGVGLPEGFDPREDGGLGFQLVRSLAKQMNASLVFDSDPLGLRFKIILPRLTANSEQ